MNRITANGSPGLSDLLEEFAGRLEAGEAVDVSAFAAAHPEHAEQLRRVLPTMLVLADLGRSASASGVAPPSEGAGSEPAAGVLGDFRIIREVGRGGMGIVYEAEQLSLGRKVALKVLPQAPMMDPRRLQRFHNEARAAACLHHNNIVPVFFVGSDRGVHFYAMQLIDGQTLADVIRGERQPEGEPTVAAGAEAAASTAPVAALSTEKPRRDAAYFRKVAELGAQAAEALDYAHQMGVIHRDVKPSNLMLDGRGQVWVTDFGLAQLQADAGLTLTGDLVGTLRYMSPEQALAQRVLVDQRTDVYSLGATLYELLTLRPVFLGEDRQELLRQIAFDETTSPRRLNRAIPEELETVVLKALEKKPQDRYATAQELADDLRRFLEDKPIRARRQIWWGRAVKWFRRKPSRAMAFGLLVLLTMLTPFAGATTWWWQTAEQARRDAEGARDQLEREKYLTEEALGRERLALAGEKRAKEDLDQILYLQRVGLAYWEWQNNEVAKAIELLEKCPKPRRNWEWGYVNRLCRGDFRDFQGHSKLVASVAFSPDGKLLATASTDQTVRIWDFLTGQQIFNLKDHKTPVKQLAFSPDGKTLASCGHDGRPGRYFPGKVLVHDVQTGRQALALDESAGIVSGVTFSPDGAFLAGGFMIDKGPWSRPAEVRLWDARTGRLKQRFQSITSFTSTKLSFSADGKRLSNAGRENWDCETGKVTFITAKPSPDSIYLAISPITDLSAWGDEDECLRIWDMRQKKESCVLRGHTQKILRATFSPNGKRIASYSSDKSIKVWDVDGGSELRTIRSPILGVGSFAFSPNGRYLASGHGDGRVRLWDVQRDPEAVSFDTGLNVANEVAFSPKGERLAIGGPETAIELDGRRVNNLPWAVRIWDCRTAREIVRIPFAGGPLAYSPDGKHLVTGTGDARVIIWDASTGQQVRSFLGHAQRITSVVFSPDSKRVASASSDKSVKVWDAESGQQLLHLEGHTFGPFSLAFSPDGARLASVAWDQTVIIQTVIIWDVATGQMVFSLRENGYLNAVLFSPDGHTLITAGSFGVGVWDSVNCRKLKLIPEITASYSNHPIALAPDGRRLAVITSTGLVRVWDLNSGMQAFTLRFKGRDPMSVAFSPNGKRLACVNLKGTVRVWEAISAD